MKRIVYVLLVVIPLCACLLSACDTGCRHPKSDARVEGYTPPSCYLEGYYDAVSVCRDCGEVTERERITVARTEHEVDGHLCTVCNEVVVSSEGLALTLTEDGEGYTLTGLGDCTDGDVYIGYHEGKPIVGIGQRGLLATDAEYNDTTERVHIGACVSEIHESALSGGYACLLAEIRVAEGNAVYDTLDGVLYTEGCERLLAYPVLRTETVYTAPEALRVVGKSAFYASTVTEVILHDGVTELGSNAFALATSLEKITLGCGITVIPDGCFTACHSLCEIELPSTVTEIKDKAFTGCKGLTSIVIHEGVTVMGERVFKLCTSLTVYCEAESEPVGWAKGSVSGWNPDGCPVVWGYDPGADAP